MRWPAGGKLCLAKKKKKAQYDNTIKEGKLNKGRSGKIKYKKKNGTMHIGNTTKSQQLVD